MFEFLQHFAPSFNKWKVKVFVLYYFQGPTKPSKKDDKILTILTRVGMSLSLTGVALTVISYLLLTYVDVIVSTDSRLRLHNAGQIWKRSSVNFCGWAHRPHHSVMKRVLFESALQNRGIWKFRLYVLVWTELHVIPLACPIFSQLMRFQISPARCERGNNKTRSGLTSGVEIMIKYGFLVFCSWSRNFTFKVLLFGVQRGIKYRYPWSLYFKAWHLAATNLHRNKIFTRLNFRISISLKVAQNNFQYFPRRRFWCVTITTRYHLMLQSWYQKTTRSPVNTFVSFLWHNRLP